MTSFSTEILAVSLMRTPRACSWMETTELWEKLHLILFFGVLLNVINKCGFLALIKIHPNLFSKLLILCLWEYGQYIWFNNNQLIDNENILPNLLGGYWNNIRRWAISRHSFDWYQLVCHEILAPMKYNILWSPATKSYDIANSIPWLLMSWRC